MMQLCVKNSDDQKKISNVEKITKYCSRLNILFEYPYFFNWSFPTNHIDSSIHGEFSDSDYMIFRIGKYPFHQEVSNISPVEQMLMFGPVSIIMRNVWVRCLLQLNDEYPVSNMQFLESHLGELKSKIDAFLKDQCILSINTAIKKYNDAYTDQTPVPLIISL